MSRDVHSPHPSGTLETPPFPAPSETRIQWIDSAKGFAICLVVFGHVLGGALARKWLEPADVWSRLYEFIYLFHMPVFFMVSGMFCVEAMRRSPRKVFMGALGSIAWPYVLWNVVIRTVLLPLIGASMLRYQPLSWSEWLTRAVTGDLSWFLWTLFVVQVVLIPIARLPTWLLLLVSLIAYGLCDYAWLGNFALVATYMPYLLFGALLRPVLERLKLTGNLLQLVAALGVFAMLAATVALDWTQSKLMKLLCGVAGSVALLLLAQCVKNSIVRSIASRLGVASLAIYLLHPYLQGAAREALYRLSGAATALQLGVVPAIAIAGSYAVYLTAERWKTLWLFRLRLASNVRYSADEPERGLSAP